MNFLVHLSLAYPSHELMTGQFIADMISKKEISIFSAKIQEGIRMHQWVDHTSNNNPSLSEINALLHPVVHKYAPVASDILCDYLLFKNWHVYFAVPYLKFVEEVYSNLSAQAKLFPKKLSNTTLRMIEGNWLKQYINYEGLENVFQRMNAIARFPVDFQTVLPVLIKNERLFEQLFIEFYEEIFNKRNEWTSLQSGRIS